MDIPQLRYPIVLVHGLFGFDKIQVAGTTLVSYWPGITEFFRNAGNRVLIPRLTPTAGVEKRAAQLKEFILKHSPDEPVHLIAHSMGGLDSRCMISCLGMADRVKSLTTIGTPHRGTSFADWGIANLEGLVKPVLIAIGMPYQAFYDLTRGHCREFNARVLDAPTVRYFSVAGRYDGSYLQPEWLVPFNVIKKAEGENDGLVSVASARHGEQCDIWDGDHLRLINWPHPTRPRLDVPAHFGPILQRLADL